MRKRLSILLGLSLVTVMSFAVVSTGAYFTGSAGGGQITGNLGTVDVSAGGMNISFDNMLPGEQRTSTVTVANTGTVPEDIYLVFDNANGAWSAINDLGAYGEFVINGTVYDNLNNQYAWGTDSSGQVISANPASGCYNVPRPAQIKYLPHVVRIGTLAVGQSYDFGISFKFHACMTAGEGAALFSSSGSPAAPLKYTVAAFQQGVDPTDQFNGGGKVTPLVLPYGTFTGTFQ